MVSKTDLFQKVQTGNHKYCEPGSLLLCSKESCNFRAAVGREGIDQIIVSIESGRSDNYRRS